MIKTALVTGSTGGIGKAIAYRLAMAGYQLQLHYHQNETVAYELKQMLKERFNRKVDLLKGDFTQVQSIQAALDQLNPIPDIIIMNAGVTQQKVVTDIEDREYQDMVHLYLTSSFMITKHVLPAMISKQWGRMVFVTSIWGETGGSCETVYSMVKGGLHSFAKALAKEVAPSGITVNAVSPGAIATSMMAGYTKGELSDLNQDIPVGRLGEPEEVAHAVHFLADEKSGYITGQVIGVNGGWYM